jgi:hypothetical protein
LNAIEENEDDDEVRTSYTDENKDLTNLAFLGANSNKGE